MMADCSSASTARLGSATGARELRRAHGEAALQVATTAALGVIGVLLLAGAVAIGGRNVLPPLLPACLFWGGLSLGSLALLLIHRLAGGRWGLSMGPPLRAAASALPVAAVLAIPLVVWVADIWSWARPGAPSGGAVATWFRAWYLEIGCFTGRALIYLAVWVALARGLGAFRSGVSRGVIGRGAAGLGLLAMLLTTTLFTFDWVMSLDPLWYSAEFGLLVGVAQATAALGLASLWLALNGGAKACGRADELHDAANLLLAGVLLWAYLSLMQFITVWIADLPEEIRWYLPRLQTDWRWLGLAVVLLHPGLALPILLSVRLKSTARGVAVAAGLVLAGQAFFALWLTLPTLRPDRLSIGALDVAVLGGVGALWLAVFLWRTGSLGPRPVPQGASR